MQPCEKKLKKNKNKKHSNFEELDL